MGRPLSGGVSFRVAAELPLVELADLYTRCFVGYSYPVRVAPAALERRVRAEQIDLARSPLLCVDGEPAGVALLAVRGAATNCAGFGITAPQRGRGLAHVLLAEHLRLARAAGGRSISLMVLEENAGAVRAYLRAGMRVTRRLLWLEWRGKEPAPYHDPGVVAAAPGALLDHFGALPRAAPFWQRDLPTLRALDGLEGWQIPTPGGPVAYALLDSSPDGPTPILDIAVATSAQAARLIAALQARHAALCINEPAESPLLDPLRAAGFTVTHTRHEMEMAL